MTVEELIYDSDSGTTFVMMVNGDEFAKYQQAQQGSSNTPSIADVMDSFSIFKYDQGHEGKQMTPSHRELKDVFGSTNDMVLAEYMLQHGELRPTHTNKPKKEKEPEGDPRGHMM